MHHGPQGRPSEPSVIKQLVTAVRADIIAWLQRQAATWERDYVLDLLTRSAALPVSPAPTPPEKASEHIGRSFLSAYDRAAERVNAHQVAMDAARAPAPTPPPAVPTISTERIRELLKEADVNRYSSFVVRHDEMLSLLRLAIAQRKAVPQHVCDPAAGSHYIPPSPALGCVCGEIQRQPERAHQHSSDAALSGLREMLVNEVSARAAEAGRLGFNAVEQAYLDVLSLIACHDQPDRCLTCAGADDPRGDLAARAPVPTPPESLSIQKRKATQRGESPMNVYESLRQAVPTRTPAKRCNPVYGSCYLASGHEGPHHGYPLTASDFAVNTLTAPQTPEQIEAALTDSVLVSENELPCLHSRTCEACDRERAAIARLRRASIIAALCPPAAAEARRGWEGVTMTRICPKCQRRVTFRKTNWSKRCPYCKASHPNAVKKPAAGKDGGA